MWNTWQNSVLGNLWSSYILNFVKHTSLCVCGDNVLHMGLLPNAVKFLPQKYKFSIQDLSIKYNQNNSLLRMNNGIMLNSHYYNLPFENDSIDCILAIHSFDQLENKYINPSIQEITRVLRPYGKLIVVNFNPYGLWHIRHKFTKYSSIDKPFLPLEPKHTGISYYSFQELMLQAGMNLQQAQFGIYDLPANTDKYSSLNKKLNKMGNRWWPNLSNIYSLIMTKHVSGIYLNTEKEQNKSAYPYNLNVQPTPKEALSHKTKY